MDEQPETREQLLAQVAALRQRVDELERGQASVRDMARSGEERLRTLFAAVPDLIIRMRKDGTFLDYSPSTEFTTYVPPDRFLGARVREIMPPDVVDVLMAGIERALLHQTREIVEYNLPERDGVQRHFEARMIKSGPDEVVAIVRDVTRREEAERALRASERRYRDLVERSQGLICTHDFDGTFLAVNPAAAASVGYEPEEVVGSNLAELIVPSARHLVEPYLERLRSEGEDSGIIHVTARDGKDRYWTYHSVVRREEGETPYVIGHALDVTDLKRAERAAQVFEARLASLFEEAPLALCNVSANGGIIAASRRFRDMLGYRRGEELVGRDVGALLAEAGDQERLLGSWQGNAAVEWFPVGWRRKDGKVLTVRSAAWPVLLRDGKLDSLQVVAELSPDSE